MQRQLSDPRYFTPRNPSRLGPPRQPMAAGPSHPKGTVSMPTSPVSRHASLWADAPHSAQPFVGISQTQYQQPPYTEPETDLAPPSSSSSFHPSNSVDSEGEPRKKRTQVRVACTHCQKACKRCSNKRPCERCEKYGIKDCIDSTRKPRKTGVKRGPYKRRSSNYEPSTNTTGRTYDCSPASSGFPPVPRSAVLQGAFASALAGPRWIHGQRLAPQYPPTPRQYLRTHAQAPRPPNLNPMYPLTPSVPFPLSLNHRDDPFSRAVSPIHRELDLAFSHAPIFSAAHREGEGGESGVRDDVTIPLGGEGHPNPEIEVEDRAFISGDSSPNENNPDANPRPNHNPISYPIETRGPLVAPFFSAPPSPRRADPNTDWSALRAAAASLHRSSSVKPTDSLHPFFSPTQIRTHTQPQSEQALQSPGFVALNKIRKPSLRTLMSTGGSQASSPVQSPTLFDGVIQMDEDVLDSKARWDTQTMAGTRYQMEYGQGPSQWTEGLGLTPFDGMMPFQT